MPGQTFKDRYERGADRMSVEEAAHRLGCKADTIKEWIRGGHVNWGQYIHTDGSTYGTWIVRRPAFEAWLLGGPPTITPTIVIDTPEAFDALCRVAVDRKDHARR